MKYTIKEFSPQEQLATDFTSIFENYLNQQAAEGWEVVSMTVFNNKLTILFSKCKD